MKLHYRKLGAGKPLFILHGLFGMSDNWMSVGKKLAESFAVYLVDLRNFGQSPHADEWTYPEMANDIKELMDDVPPTLKGEDKKNSSLQGGGRILLGHSMGGKAAMQFASMYPEKLEKLIVVDIAPKDYPVSSTDFVYKLDSVKLEELNSRKEADEKLSVFIKDEATKQLLLKNIYRDENDKLKWKFNLKVIAENQNEIGKTFSVKNNIQIAALFIKGEKSNYILDSDIPVIKKIFPLAELKTIADAGHWVHAEKPEEFVKVVNEFING